jgi:hypothetical protein
MNASEVTDDFADALLRKIQPGIKWMLTNKHPMQRQPDTPPSGGGRGGGGGRGRGGQKQKAAGY